MRKWGLALMLLAQGAAAEPMCLTPLPGGGMGEGVVEEPVISAVGLRSLVVPGREAIYVQPGVVAPVGEVEDGRVTLVEDGPFERLSPLPHQVILRRDGRVQAEGRGLHPNIDVLYDYDAGEDVFRPTPMGATADHVYFLYDPRGDRIYAALDGVLHLVEDGRPVPYEGPPGSDWMHVPPTYAPEAGGWFGFSHDGLWFRREDDAPWVFVTRIKGSYGMGSSDAHRFDVVHDARTDTLTLMMSNFVLVTRFEPGDDAPKVLYRFWGDGVALPATGEVIAWQEPRADPRSRRTIAGPPRWAGARPAALPPGARGAGADSDAVPHALLRRSRRSGLVPLFHDPA